MRGLLSGWSQPQTISRISRILQTSAYTYIFQGRILRTVRIRTYVNVGSVSAYFCGMRILCYTCIQDTAYSFFAVYVSVRGYRVCPCVARACLTNNIVLEEWLASQKK